MTTSASTELGDPASRLLTKIFEGHTDYVNSVAYFHDGKRIISGSDDNTARIWDAESQKQDGESLMPDFEVYSVALSPDERRLVSVVGKGRGVVLWDLGGGTAMWKKELDGFRVAYSPDGLLIAASNRDAIVLLNAETGERIRDPLQFGESVWSLAFSPDGTRLAAGSMDGNVRVLDVATGESIVGPIRAHENVVSSLLYTFDGQQIITASWDNSIRVWDAATGQEVGDSMLGHKKFVYQIALSCDGQRLASSSLDSTVRVWDLKTRRQIGGSLQAQDGHQSSAPRLQAQGLHHFLSVAWSPDGRSVVAGHTDGEIFLWDAPLDDHPVIPHAPDPTTSNPPVLSSSRPRSNSISSSILNMPAELQRPNQTLATDRCPDDFFDSTPDLPGRANNQISTIPVTALQVPPRSSIPNVTKPKTGSKILPASTPSPSNFFGRVGSRFRREKHAPETIEMQPPPPKLPKYSPVGKVALGQADKRLYMDESKDKKRQPGDSDSEQEVLVDVEVNCWDIFCAIITSCFSCCSTKDSGSQHDNR